MIYNWNNLSQYIIINDLRNLPVVPQNRILTRWVVPFTFISVWFCIDFLIQYFLFG